MEDLTRRAFLKAAGLTLAGLAAAGSGLAQEKEKEKEKPQEAPKKPEEKKAESAEPDKEKEKDKEKKEAKSDEADWDAVSKQSGSEETRTCPQCGATMYRQGRTWTCDNCGYSYVE